MGGHEENKGEKREAATNLYKQVNIMTENTKKGRSTIEKAIHDGDKGVTIKLFQRNKVGDKDDTLKVSVKQMGDDKFGVRITKNGSTDEKDYDRTKLIKFLKENKDMKFALDYIESGMEKFRKSMKMSGGARRKTSKRKSSKKKASKKKSSKRKGSKRKSSKRRPSKRKGTKKKASKRKSSKRKSSKRKSSKKKK